MVGDSLQIATTVPGNDPYLNIPHTSPLVLNLSRGYADLLASGSQGLRWPGIWPACGRLGFSTLRIFFWSFPKNLSLSLRKAAYVHRAGGVYVHAREQLSGFGETSTNGVAFSANKITAVPSLNRKRSVS